MPPLDAATPAAGPAVDDAAAFRRAQRLAYDAALEVARGLAPGVTEKEAAARLGRVLGERGIRRWFHRPFAWFGERSRFAGFGRLSLSFFPTDQRLERGMVGILDVAPIAFGCIADIGYTFRLGGSDPALDRAMATLRDVRAMIPELVTRGDTMRSIYGRVEQLFVERGYDNRHSRYPFGVLGHRVRRVRDRRWDPKVAGFGLSSLATLLGEQLTSNVPVPAFVKRSPFWTGDEAANRPIEPGLWAIEPHLGAEGFGAKFEEILVVERGRAFWLDDDVPHARAAVC